MADTLAALTLAQTEDACGAREAACAVIGEASSTPAPTRTTTSEEVRRDRWMVRARWGRATVLMAKPFSTDGSRHVCRTLLRDPGPRAKSLRSTVGLRGAWRVVRR